MKPAQSKPTNNGCDHSQVGALNLSAAKLDVYERERLAFTENPVRIPEPRPFFKRGSALQRAFYFWVHSRL
jgi:hypothetical protein